MVASCKQLHGKPQQCPLGSSLPPSPPPAAQVHKLLQGLIDQYSLAGQEAALGMAEGMASYFCGRCGVLWYTNWGCMVSAGLWLAGRCSVVGDLEVAVQLLSGAASLFRECEQGDGHVTLLLSCFISSSAARRVARVLEVNGTDHWQKILETEFGGMSEAGVHSACVFYGMSAGAMVGNITRSAPAALTWIASRVASCASCRLPRVPLSPDARPATRR